jgi:carbamoyltransferase
MSVYWGVNLSHNGSICKLKNNGQIDWFTEEERWSRKKYDSFPSSILPVLKSNQDIDSIEFGSLYEIWDESALRHNVYIFNSLVEKITKKENIKNQFYKDHHIFHAACGFYNSGFAESSILVVDGAGNSLDDNVQEVESIFTMKYPNILTKHHVNITPNYIHSNLYFGNNYPVGIGMMYSAIADYFQFGSLDSGKVMGMSAYGVEDENIKPFYNNKKLDSSQFYRTRVGLKFIPYDYVKVNGNPTDLKNPKLQIMFNLAYRMQKNFESYMSNLILYALSITNQKNIILTGGCALNCVANYKYLKMLPKDINLYIEPISSDAGTAIGLAKLKYYHETGSTDINSLKTLYLGLEK